MRRSRRGRSNWSGSVRFSPRRVERPSSVDDVVAVVRRAAARGEWLRTMGSAHSFTPLIATPDVLVSLDRLQGVLEVDHEVGTASVLAGTKLHRLGSDLAAHGVAQENLGDVDAQAIAGAISTGTHGTGGNFGSLSTQLVAATLVTAAGDVVRCSVDHYPRMFEAARLSLGAVGILLEVTLKVRPAFVLHHRDLKMSLTDCLARIPALRDENRHFEFYWFPHTERVHVKVQNQTTAPARREGLVHFVDEVVVTNGVFRVLSEISRRAPRLAPAVARASIAGLRPEERTARSHEIFATRRLVRFQEMEYAVPAEDLPDIVREINSWVARRRYPVHFPVECRFGPPEDTWLGPAHGRPTGYVAVHAFRGMPYREYFAAAEAVFRSCGGRPHWGKLHSLSATELGPLYPRWSDFLDVRAELDPDGLFLNDHLRSLFDISP